jgi:septum formation protein
MSDPADLHPLWLGRTPLVLASGSQTRLGLLEAVGIPVQVEKPAVDERAIATPMEAARVSPSRVAAALARAKALDVSRRNPGRVVLGGDQTLSLAGGFLHKPKDRADAAHQLMRLSGVEHRLHAAVALVRDGRRLASFTQTARLTVRPLSDDMITRYLDAAGDSVFASVGGYQLEALGAHLFARVTGDHSTILGLPMQRTLQALRHLGLVAE